MKRTFSFIILLIVVAFIASTSCLLTRYYWGKTPSPKSGQDVFKELNLTPEQAKKIDAIREQFSVCQHQCMTLMQQRNRELAEVIIADKTNSPRVQDAVEKIHEAMGDMQKATLNSIFAAKDVLTPEQYEKLLQLVAGQLSTGVTNSCCP